MEWFLLLFIPAFSVVKGALVEYSDLEALGVDCRPRDTCSNNSVRGFSDRSCECDDQCHSFDDCCVDAPAARSGNKVHRRLGITCLPFDPDQGVYATGKCRSSWNGSDLVLRKCENQDDFSDPLASLPSTDTHTNVTYKNHYCAECNYANQFNLSTWDAKLTCSSLADINALFNNITQDFIMERITWLGSSWGVYLRDETTGGGMTFYPCEVSVHLPRHLTPHIRYCRPHVISTCAAKWSCNTVRKQCLGYMAVIYFRGVAYRNAHCAICNCVPVSNPTCALTVIRANPSLSFTLLLDVNPSDGDEVGVTNRCPAGQKYDPFFKKCRTLVCALPGHILRDGRCVRQ